MMIRYLIVLFSFVCVDRAEATTPLSADEAAGLKRYCSVMYESNQLPALQKDAYCMCFLNEVSKVDPVVRSMIILIADDPNVGTETKNKMNELAKHHSPQQKEALIAQMTAFVAESGPKCVQEMQKNER